MSSETLKQAKALYGEPLSRKLLKLAPASEGAGAQELSTQEIHDIIDKTEELISQKGRFITSSQLRNIFAAVKEQDVQDLNSLALLRPRLAYISARQKNREARIITDLIGELIREVRDSRGLQSLQTLMEIMVAYHKLYHS